MLHTTQRDTTQRDTTQRDTTQRDTTQRDTTQRIAVGLLALAVLSGDSPHTMATEIPTTTVFQAGTQGYNIYRIPAIVRAANGDLLAFCEAREGGDASEIDLVLKRSVDGGKSWARLQVVQQNDDYRALFAKDPPPITVGNPAPVVDLLDPEHPGRIWLPLTLENDRVFVISSDDHGKTWSRRREITADVKLEPWGWYATGPVHSIQISRGPHKGRLVIPCDHKIGRDGRNEGACGAHAIISDDHGRSWRLGAIDDSYGDSLEANETSVVQLNDNRLYFNTRDQNGDAPGTRGEAWSDDGGQSFRAGDSHWGAFRPAPVILDPPVVQSALLRAASTRDGDPLDLILFSGPDENGPSGAGRSDLRLRYSTDEARSWQDGPIIHTGPAAYSDLVRITPETIGVLLEAGEKRRYERIDFAIVSLEQIAPAAVGRQ